jgi:hypothetical protein
MVKEHQLAGCKETYFYPASNYYLWVLAIFSKGFTNDSAIFYTKELAFAMPQKEFNVK